MMYSGISVPYAFSVWPCVVSVQTSSLSPKSGGTLILKWNRLRRGMNQVGWPWSGPPGSKRLSGPTGTWRCSSRFRLKYPNTML